MIWLEVCGLLAALMFAFFAGWLLARQTPATVTAALLSLVIAGAAGHFLFREGMGYVPGAGREIVGAYFTAGVAYEIISDAPVKGGHLVFLRAIADGRPMALLLKEKPPLRFVWTGSGMKSIDPPATQ